MVKKKFQCVLTLFGGIKIVNTSGVGKSTNWRAEASPPLSVEIVEFSLNMFLFFIGERKRAHPCLLNLSNSYEAADLLTFL